MTRILPPDFHLFSPEDIDRIRKLWRKAVPKRYADLLDAEFKLGQSIVDPREIGPRETMLRVSPGRLRPILDAISDIPYAEAYIWNYGAQRYQTESGTFLPLGTVQRLLDGVSAVSTDPILNLTQRLIEGDITTQAWSDGLAAHLRDLHVVGAAAAAGGWLAMTAAAWSRLRSLVLVQFEFLRNTTEDLEFGRQKLDGSLLNRMALYPLAARTTFEEVRRDQAQTTGLYTHERRVLGGGDACDDCQAAAGAGWVPIGTLPPIGNTQCRTHCRCHFLFQ